MYYLIKESLEECAIEEIKYSGSQYVALLTSEEWYKYRESFEMGIDMELDLSNIHNTKADVNYDSLTGTFCIPNRKNFYEEHKFAFALDEKGIVFIDDSGTAQKMVNAVRRTKKWRLPSLERFMYDFLEQIIRGDMKLMEQYDRQLDEMEYAILNEDADIASMKVNDIRSDIRDIKIHYEQLMDFAQTLEENENSFFKPENIRYFRLFANKIERLRDTSASVRDYTMQIRDLYKAQLDIKQNKIMTILTVVTTIFMPLTLIVGWYGMNFKYMPELDKPMAYPVIIVLSVLIVVFSLIFFKKKKWL